MPKFSIILPVKNGGEYVKQCVGSILTQRYTDFTFHILDNSSTDGTLEWISSLKDDRIIIYPSAIPLSIEENWKRVLSIKKNEFITLIGHDDLLEPDYLEVMDSLIRSNPAANLYQTHFRYIDKNGDLIRKCKPMPERMNATEFLAAFLTNNVDTMGTGFMMRSADYDSVGGIPTSYPNLLFADFELWIKLIRDRFLAISPQECFAFRLHASTTLKSPDVKFHSAFGQFISYLDQLKQKDGLLADAIHKYANQYIEFYAKGLSHRLLRTPIQKREGLTVATFLAACKVYAHSLAPGQPFHPEKKLSVKLARFIDSNSLTRSLFLLFKKIRPRPIYS